MSLYPGGPAPWFHAPTPSNPAYYMSSLGGRYILIAFLPPPGPQRLAALQLLDQHRGLFQRPGPPNLFFGVIPDPPSFAQARDQPPGIRWFDDRNGQVRRLYDAETADGGVDPQWVLLDPTMRVLATAPLADGAQILERLAALGDPDDYAGAPIPAPVLIVPRVLEPELCRTLIEVYRRDGGGVSGVMRERDGKTVGVVDDFKRRRDATIADPTLRKHLRVRFARRLLPEVEKVFNFRAGYIERYIVACYDAGDGGYFRPHRDNTTAGTAHRRFAVSINLNAEEFEGGDLRFPEFGRQTYRPPTGGAVVFCCSLLHEAMPVTQGTRYATLPFLYDEAGARIRERNAHLLETAAAET